MDRETTETKLSYHQSYYQRNKERISKRVKLRRQQNLELFRKREREGYARNRERELELARLRRNRPDQKAKIKERDRRYRKNNKEKTKEQGRRYYQKHKAKILKKTSVRNRLRRKNDPTFALKSRIRDRIKEILYRINFTGTRKKKMLSILGCTILELKAHIESQFKPGMTWENRSEWHIDHIIPLASAKTEDDIYRLNHYTNLRPLWPHENRKKGAKMPSENELILRQI